jgi:hypothetical protein
MTSLRSVKKSRGGCAIGLRGGGGDPRDAAVGYDSVAHALEKKRLHDQAEKSAKEAEEKREKWALEQKRLDSATPESDPLTWCEQKHKKSNAYRPFQTEDFLLNPSSNNIKHLSKQPFPCPEQFKKLLNNEYEFYKYPEETTKAHKFYLNRLQHYQDRKLNPYNLDNLKPPAWQRYELVKSKIWPHKPLRKTIRGVLDYRINNENRKNHIPYKERLLELGAKPKTERNPVGKARLAKKEDADHVRWDLWGKEIQDPRPKAKGGKKTRRVYKRRQI